MINGIKHYINRENNPYKNIALEEFFLKNVAEDECVLYLWQNENTVVIGRNQNAWSEVNVEKLESDDGFLARRLSGGGAVYHDLGNLNFTFLVPTKYYDVEKQMEVILKSLEYFGLKAEKSGRNDATIDGKKFSGNAYYDSKGKSYHHGTLMVDVRMDDLPKYLNVSKKKLESKGIKSVKSRVANLKEHSQEITISSLQEALIKAFSDIYGFSSKEITLTSEDEKEIEKRYDFFSSWDWRLGKNPKFEHDLFSEKFAWGEISIHFTVKSGKVEECKVFSDAMDAEFAQTLEKSLLGAKYNREEIENAIKSITETKEIYAEMKRDTFGFILENI